MGLFSWETCDTKESVMNAYTDKCKTVYFLQPNGKPSLKEVKYEGQGVFCGVDAYQWLIEENASHLGIDLSGISDDMRRDMGLDLALGLVYKDLQTGEYWCAEDDLISFNLLLGGLVTNLFRNELAIMCEYRASAAELESAGLFKAIEIKELVELRYPIKVSFDNGANYNEQPASSVCQKCGYFDH